MYNASTQGNDDDFPTTFFPKDVSYKKENLEMYY
jgi:hypothetical protein